MPWDESGAVKGPGQHRNQSPTFPAALAVGEQSGASGRDVLVASVLGMEVCCRIGMVVVEEQYNHSWHITDTCGVFGAAMTVAMMMLGMWRPKLTEIAFSPQN